ncbi:MAG: hypothetical protein KDB86_13995, partial [Actinobacteria bacterium]|nr:hypothetical protein [Actinomycetota bacterium]
DTGPSSRACPALRMDVARLCDAPRTGSHLTTQAIGNGTAESSDGAASAKLEVAYACNAHSTP